MAEAAVRASLMREPVILLCRHTPGRNLHTHRHGNITLDEITRWSLYVQPPTLGPATIDCCARDRHLTVPWTIRMDWRLPDGGRYPYCPVKGWRRGTTQVFRTSQSRPAWIDAQDQDWARPNISGGSGYHWDVFLNPDQHSRIGLSQLNIVGVGGPSSENAPGSIHHMPPEKRAHFKDRGWTCPPDR